MDKLPLKPVCDDAEAPPVNPPVTVGADQAYVVFAGMIFPLVPCAGVNENALPLQASIAGTLTVAFGLIVTV